MLSKLDTNRFSVSFFVETIFSLERFCDGRLRRTGVKRVMCSLCLTFFIASILFVVILHFLHLILLKIVSIQSSIRDLDVELSSVSNKPLDKLLLNYADCQ